MTRTAIRGLCLLAVMMPGSALAVVGGTPAEPGSSPWTAALVYSFDEVDQSCLDSGGSEVFCRQVCGTTLIGGRWAMTAAHCLFNRTNTDYLAIAVGSEDLNSPDMTTIPVQSFYTPTGVPPTSTVYQNDIALLYLQSAPSQSPVSLIDQQNLDELLAAPDGDDLVEVRGWGRLGTGAGFPSQLQRVRLELTPTNCGGILDPGTMFCASETTPELSEIDDSGDLSPADTQGEDACELDSGGPLLYRPANGLIWQLGIVSWGVDSDCGSNEFGTAYARVPAFLSWIENTSDAAEDPLVDLATEIVMPTSTEIATSTARVYLHNRSTNAGTSINNASVKVTYTGTGALGAPVTSGMSCSALTEETGYSCTPTVNPLFPGVIRYADFAISSLQADQTLAVEATAIRGDGEADYRAANDQQLVSISRTSKADLILKPLGAVLDVAGTLLTLSYQLENASSHSPAEGNTMTITLPDGYAYSAVSLGACVDGAPIFCTLPDLDPGEVVIARLELVAEAFNDGEAVALASTSSGDYPTLRGGVSDTMVTTPIIWPEIPPPVAGSKGGGSVGLLWLLGVATLLSRARSIRTLTRG
ncbi:MAG: serine protease [Alcanivoracaceae bacterium]|nr:serine protease [Alcanivoracaceae bacterium]